MTFINKNGVVFKKITILDLEGLVSLIIKLTHRRREWTCTTSDAGWTVEYESYEGDALNEDSQTHQKRTSQN